MAQSYDVYFARMLLTLGLVDRDKLQRELQSYQRSGSTAGFPRHLVQQKLLEARQAEKVAADLEQWFKAQKEKSDEAGATPSPAAKRSSVEQKSPLARESARVKKTTSERVAAEPPREAPAPPAKPATPDSSRVKKTTGPVPTVGPRPVSERVPADPVRETPSKPMPRESGRLKKSSVGGAVEPRDATPRESQRLKRASGEQPVVAKSSRPSDVGANPSEQELVPAAERGERDAKQWALFEKATKDPLSKLVGRTLGRTKLTKLVQTGEVVTVFEGEYGDDERGAIVKVLRPERAKDKVGVERFTREGQLLAKIDHPNIARVLEVGAAEGVRFLAMEVGGGEPLSSLLERSGRLPAERVVRLARGVALGLAAAHKAGIVHRDLRPANVLVEGDGTVKLVGFGIARELSVPGRLTATGQITGHPAYVAPEIAMGDEITGKADVYSLGVVLYLALAGRLPFESRSLVKLVAMHLNSAPPPLLQAAKGCPPKLAALVQIKLLAKDPALRPEAQEVATALAAKDLLEGGAPAGSGMEKKPDTEEELRRAMATDEHPAVGPGGPGCAACELPLGPNSSSVHGNSVCERCLERVEALDLCAACLQEVPSSSADGVCVFAGHIYCKACTARVKLPCVVCKKDVPLAGLGAGQAKVKGDQLVHFTCPPR